ncbi:MAG: site-specific integrase, partial [Planctomycetota bacterium]
MTRAQFTIGSERLNRTESSNIPLLHRPESRDRQGPAIEKLVERFLDQLWAEAGLSDNTLAAYRNDLKSLIVFCEQKDISFRDLTPTDIQNYLIHIREE